MNKNKEKKIEFYTLGKFYFLPHYMSCMSWSPDRGQLVYKWLWFIFAIERKEARNNRRIVKWEMFKMKILSFTDDIKSILKYGSMEKGNVMYELERYRSIVKTAMENKNYDIASEFQENVALLEIKARDIGIKL